MPIRIVEPSHAPGQAEDIARGALTGLTEGATAVPGFLGDVRQMGQSAADAIAGFAKRHGVDLGKAPQLPGMASPFPGADALVRIGAKAANVDPRLARIVSALTTPAGLAQAPTSAEIQGAVTHDTPLYQPTSRAGKYARAITQMAPAALTPGTAVQRVARVVVPGAASEAAGELAKGTPAEPYARVAAALLASGGVELATGAHPRTRMLADATRGATDADITAARALMERAQAEGVRLTMPEALQQVTSGATGATRLQRVVEGTPAGAERIAPVMADRPRQVRGAVMNYADTIAPATENPGMVGAQAREAASGVLNGVRQGVNANARPFYDALAEERMPPTPAYQALAGSPAYQEALQSVRGNPLLNQPIAALPDDSLAVVNEVVKQLDTLAENARPNPAASTGNAQLAAAYEAARNSADELASAYSEPWRLSRAMVASGREAFLEPLQRGPLGAISATDKLKGQLSALYPSKPAEGSAAESVRALTMLGEENPAVPRSLTRQYLVQALNGATKDLQGGENQWGGASFATNVAGTPELEALTMGGAQAAGGDPQRLRNLVEVLQATGRREHAGSQTAFNVPAIEKMGEAGTPGEILRTGLNLPGAFRRVGQRFQDWQTERNAGRLAEAILASPEEAEAILRHARQVVPEGAGLRAVEQAALAAQLSRRQQLEGAR
jgi:hypothetical protein